MIAVRTGQFPYLNPPLAKKTLVIREGKYVHQEPLPQHVYETFKTLSKPERNQYVWRLRTEEGWTLQSIASAVGVTREMIRLIVKELNQTSFTLLLDVGHLVVPKRTITKTLVSTRMMMSPETVTRLKELHKEASKVRGKSPAYRKEAEEFTRLIHEQTLLGVSTYTMAKELGLRLGAINLRLIRYGYRKTNGKSNALRIVQHRYDPQQKKEATHDNTTSTHN